MEYINACCLVLPSGETLWFELKAEGYLEKVFKKWRGENPEYVNENCSAGAVAIKIPAHEYYDARSRTIGAFEFP